VVSSIVCKIAGNSIGQGVFFLMLRSYLTEEFDQIMLSARNLSGIWVIDQSTTTEQALQAGQPRHLQLPA
jgi:hypothetical protein